MNEKLSALLESVQRTAVQAGKIAADAAYGVGKKGSELLSVAKLNISIVERKNEVNHKLKEVGEILYATHTGVPTDSEVLLNKLQEIDALKEEIAQMQALIRKEEASVTCETCGAEVREDDVFCGACGDQL